MVKCFYCKLRVNKNVMQPTFANLCKDCYQKKENSIEEGLKIRDASLHPFSEIIDKINIEDGISKMAVYCRPTK